MDLGGVDGEGKWSGFLKGILASYRRKTKFLCLSRRI